MTSLSIIKYFNVLRYFVHPLLPCSVAHLMDQFILERIPETFHRRIIVIIATAKSKDAGSAKNGGDLEWQAPNRFVKPFSDAMIALKKGAFSQTPVKSDFGYHIIKLEDSREAKKPEFNQVKEQLKPRLQQQQIETMITEMRAKAKVEEK